MGCHCIAAFQSTLQRPPPAWWKPKEMVGEGVEATLQSLLPPSSKPIWESWHHVISRYYKTPWCHHSRQCCLDTPLIATYIEVRIRIPFEETSQHWCGKPDDRTMKQKQRNQGPNRGSGQEERQWKINPVPRPCQGHNMGCRPRRKPSWLSEAREDPLNDPGAREKGTTEQKQMYLGTLIENCKVFQ